MGEVRKLWIPGPAGRLEAALRVASDPVGAAVVCHPHPLHGGTLHNPVIFHSERELHRRQRTTLRFNFRGAGESSGAHDRGRGEVDDVAAAVSWLKGIVPGVPMLLAGFSFGSWCAVRYAVGDPDIAGLVTIGLPVRLYDLSLLERFHRPLAVVQAEHDEFGSPDEVRALIDPLTPPGTLSVVAGTGHLFPQRARDAAAEVMRMAAEMPGRD